MKTAITKKHARQMIEMYWWMAPKSEHEPRKRVKK